MGVFQKREDFYKDAKTLPSYSSENCNPHILFSTIYIYMIKLIYISMKGLTMKNEFVRNVLKISSSLNKCSFSFLNHDYTEEDK